MDDFDFLNQPSATPTDPQIPADDLFGADNNQANESTMNNSNTQSSAFDEESTNDFLPRPSASGTEDTSIFDQSNNDEFDATPSNANRLTSDESLLNSSFDTISHSMPSSSHAESASKSSEALSPLQAFNQRRQEEIAAKDAEEKQRKDALREQAKNDLERWYQDRKMMMERKRETMKEEEDALRTTALQKSDKESCDWAKVIRFLDFSPGSQLSKSKRDVTRMKSCIIHAKRDKDSKKSDSSA